MAQLLYSESIRGSSHVCWDFQVRAADLGFSRNLSVFSLKLQHLCIWSALIPLSCNGSYVTLVSGMLCPCQPAVPSSFCSISCIVVPEGPSHSQPDAVFSQDSCATCLRLFWSDTVHSVFFSLILFLQLKHSPSKYWFMPLSNSGLHHREEIITDVELSLMLRFIFLLTLVDVKAVSLIPDDLFGFLNQLLFHGLNIVRG